MKPVFNDDHPREDKIGAVVDRWLLLRGSSSNKNDKRDHLVVVIVGRWSLLRAVRLLRFKCCSIFTIFKMGKNCSWSKSWTFASFWFRNWSFYRDIEERRRRRLLINYGRSPRSPTERPCVPGTTALTTATICNNATNNNRPQPGLGQGKFFVHLFMFFVLLLTK